MRIYAVTSNSKFVGFIKAETEKKARQKIKALPYPAKLDTKYFIGERIWHQKHRKLDNVRDLNGPDIQKEA